MRSNKFITPLVILAFMVLTLGLYPASSTAREKYEEKFEKTVSLAKDGQVILRNISGDIDVKSWGKAEVKIDALKISRASSLSKAKENAAKVTVQVDKENQTVHIETKYPKMKVGGLNVSINYSLTIPEMASIKIKSVSGDLTLSQIGGAVETDTVSGDVEIMKARKGVDSKAVSGDLELQDVSGDSYLKTVSGDIVVERINGSVEAESVSGDVDLREVTGAEDVEGSVLSGSITYQGDILSGGRYYLKSHSGEVKMILPSDAAFNVEAKTFSGNIESDFDITVSGRISKKEIQGSVNGGGAKVTLKTFSGNIQIIKK